MSRDELKIHHTNTFVPHTHTHTSGGTILEQWFPSQTSHIWHNRFYIVNMNEMHFCGEKTHPSRVPQPYVCEITGTRRNVWINEYQSQTGELITVPLSSRQMHTHTRAAHSMWCDQLNKNVKNLIDQRIGKANCTPWIFAPNWFIWKWSASHFAYELNAVL